MIQELIIRCLADYTIVPVVIVGTYALIFMVPKGHRLEAYSRTLMAGLTAYFLAKMIGTLFQPSAMRPFEILGENAGASFLNNPGFPSDHVLFVAAITCAVWFETKQKLITIVLILLMLTICLGRIFALVHSPVDIVGGIVIALIGSLWYVNGKNVV